MANRKDMGWMRKLKDQKLSTFDVSEDSVSVTDLKHYFYCPRIVYFDKVLHIKPNLGSQQIDGGEQHEEYVKKENRRKDAVYYSIDFIGASKMFFVPLYSHRLKLSGTIDLIVRTRSGEYVPIEYKNMMSNHGRVWSDHKYQLVAYALLIDESFDACVKRGFINYIPEDRVIMLEITQSMKIFVKRALRDIEKIIREEKLPPIRVSRKKCGGGCGFKFLCPEQTS